MICGICRDESNSEDFVTPCGHSFHEDCIKDWFKNQRKCPYCFQRISYPKILFLGRGNDEVFDKDFFIKLLNNSYDYELMTEDEESINTILNQNWKFNEEDLKECVLLNMVCQKGVLSIVRLLVKCGADVNAVNQKGFTVLNLECRRRNNMEIIRFLIDSGADVNAANIYGSTPLHMACKIGNLNIARILIDSGANVNSKRKQTISKQPLLHAS